MRVIWFKGGNNNIMCQKTNKIISDRNAPSQGAEAR